MGGDATLNILPPRSYAHSWRDRTDAIAATATQTERRTRVFFVGQRVICIDDRIPPDFFHRGETLLKRGVVYTIRGIVLGTSFGYNSDHDGLRLAEIRNPMRVYRAASGHVWAELYFLIARFRPMHETNIDVFRAMLKKASQPRRRVRRVSTADA
jgi:hypothetical protein